MSGPKTTSAIRRTSGPPRNTTLELGKLPPQAIDLEEAVLGACMLEKPALAQVDFLKPDHFYHESHKVIFQAIRELMIKSEPVDMRTVASKLKQQGKLEMAGGAYYIAELTSKVASSANVEYHARIITELAIKRFLINLGSEIAQRGYEDTTDTFELMDWAETTLYNLHGDMGMRIEYKDGLTLGLEAIQTIQERMTRKDGLSGVPSGFSTLDRITHGWQPGEMIVIAARPGMGKTSFILSMVEMLVTMFEIPVGIFSLEMTSLELTTRLFSINTEIDSERIKKGSISNIELKLLMNSKVSSKKNLFVDDTPSLDINQLRTKARRMVERHGVRIILLDYLQLLKITGHTGNREQEIAGISRSLKALAKELKVPVIALSQLSRGVETRGGDKRPMLSDLRESGAIEQDADVVCFLYRPEYYKIHNLEDGTPSQGVAEAILAKNRNGRLDTAYLRFIGKFTKFADMESRFDAGERHPSWPTEDESQGPPPPGADDNPF